MMCKGLALKLSLSAALCSLSVTAMTQTANVAAATTVATTAVPRLITYSGVLKDAAGKTLNNITGVTFLLYKDVQGGSPLWLETQNVTPDKTGHYSVQLGATSAEGLPPDLFVSGEARWLAVQVVSDAEQERVLLVAVPYAIKAADAETIGGLPPSAFVLAAPPTGGNAASTTSNSAAAQAAASVSPLVSSNVTTTGGSTGTIPMFTTATNIQNSILTQTATTAINIGGKLNLPAIGTATALNGFNSRPQQFIASVFNSGTATPVPQNFAWQAEPVNNDKTTATGTLNLLYATGTATPAETGLKINNKGLFTFAAGQTFPGTGTVSSVTAGPGLTGGTITHTGTIGIAAGGVSNGDLAHSSLSVLAGADLTGGGLVSLGGSTTLNLDTTKVPTLAASNSFTGATNTFKDIETSTLEGVSISDYAFSAFENAFVADQFFAGNGIFMDVGDPGCGSGFAGIGFNGLSGCSNYSLLGDGTNTYLNRPSGGKMLFRNGNGDEMILSGGKLGIGLDPTNDSRAVDVLAGDKVAAALVNNSSVFDTVFIESDTTSTGTGNFMIAADNFNTGGGFLDLDTAGDLTISGSISKGGGSFKIDHPLDPGNKFLYHSFVESPDMKNIYDGVAMLDGKGEAVVELPAWFETLNRDFRYQLTAIGGPGPNLYVAEEVHNNSFKIAGGQSGLKVSWQLTGIRQDAWANAHRIPVDANKVGDEVGHYLHPELYGQPKEKGIAWAHRQRQLMLEKSKQAPVKASFREPKPSPKLTAGRAPTLLRPPIATTNKK